MQSLQFKHNWMQHEQQIERLKRQLLQIADVCSYCHKSEELARCTVFTFPCKKNVCAVCFKEHSNQTCSLCMNKISVHVRKNRNAEKDKMYEEACKQFNRQKKLRGGEEWEGQQNLLIDMMAYLNFHPHPNRRRYEEYQRQMKREIAKVKRQNQKVIGEVDRKYLNDYKTITTREDGRETCGYEISYQKGISLIYRAFDFYGK